MKKLIILCAALGAIVLAGAVFRGKLEDRERHDAISANGTSPRSLSPVSGGGRTAPVPEGISSVSFNSAGDLKISIGSVNSLKISGDPDTVAKFRVETHGSRLELGDVFKDNFRQSSAHLLLELTLTRLEDLELVGSGDVTLEGVFTAPYLLVKLTGTGSLSGTVALEKLRAELVGNSDLSLRGRAGELDANVNGLGDLDCPELSGEKADVDLVGLGDVRIGRFEELDASLVGTGDIDYRGDPRITKNGVGTGDLTRIGD